MLGKSMWIATMCTLAFAICGDRVKAVEKEEEEKTSRTVPSTTSTKGSSTSRWLAKSLILGAFVHSASGFAQPALGSPVHAAIGLDLHTLEPLSGWGWDTDWVFKICEAERADKAERIEDILVAAKIVYRKKNHVPREKFLSKVEKDLQDLKKKNFEKLWLGVIVEDAKAESFEDVIVAAANVGFDGHAIPWEHWLEKDPWEAFRPKLEKELQGLKKKHLEKLWLGGMVENAKRCAEKGHKFLDKIGDETSFQSNRAEWRALEDDMREFKKWQKEADQRYHTVYHKFRTPAGIRALEALNLRHNDNYFEAQRNAKTVQILDVLDAAERGDHFNVDGIPWEEYDIGHAPASFGSPYPKLKAHLQRMKGKRLHNLWLSATLDGAKRDAEKEGELLNQIRKQKKYEAYEGDETYVEEVRQRLQIKWEKYHRIYDKFIDTLPFEERLLHLPGPEPGQLGDGPDADEEQLLRGPEPDRPTSTWRWSFRSPYAIGGESE